MNHQNSHSITSADFVQLFQQELIGSGLISDCSINKAKQIAKTYAATVKKEMHRQASLNIAANSTEKTTARIPAPDIGTFVVTYTKQHHYFNINTGETALTAPRYTAKLIPSNTIAKAATGILITNKPRGRQAKKTPAKQQ